MCYHQLDKWHKFTYNNRIRRQHKAALFKFYNWTSLNVYFPPFITRWYCFKMKNNHRWAPLSCNMWDVVIESESQECLGEIMIGYDFLRYLQSTGPRTHVSGFELTSTRTVGVQIRRTSRSAIYENSLN